MRPLVLVVMVALLGSCAEGGSVATEPRGLISNPGQVALETECGPLRIPIGDISENLISVSLPDEPLDTAAQQALAEMQQAFAPEANVFDDFTWTMADQTDDELSLFGRGADHMGYAYAFADRNDDEWHIRRFGGCQLRVAAAGYGSAIWVLDVAPDAAQSVVALIINENECASGQPPDDREIVPVVLSDEEQVTIVVLVEPVSGNANCLSNPWHPVMVQLGSPLGERQLFDGGTVPPRLQEWPPSQEDLDRLGQSG